MPSKHPKLPAIVMLVVSMIVLGFGLAMTRLDSSQVPAPLLSTPTAKGSCTPTESYEHTLTGVSFPRRPDLPGLGPRLSFRGTVRAGDCTALSGMAVEFWAADPTGQYTPDSYGSVLTDDAGEYSFTTPFPGTYPGSKAPHVHVRVTYAANIIVVTEVLPEEGTDVYTLDIVPGFMTPPTSTTSTVPDRRAGQNATDPIS
jgi:protocatechuate 3,4-dioxygenase beta subunit